MNYRMALGFSRHAQSIMMSRIVMLRLAAYLRTVPAPSWLRLFAVNPLLFLVTFQPLPLIIDPSVKAKAVGLWSRIFNMTSS